MCNCLTKNLIQLIFCNVLPFKLRNVCFSVCHDVQIFIFQIQEEQVQFIRNHFKQKECCRFVADPKQFEDGKSCTVKALK